MVCGLLKVGVRVRALSFLFPSSSILKRTAFKSPDSFEEGGGWWMVGAAMSLMVWTEMIEL